MTAIVVRTRDGVSHGVESRERAFYHVLETPCGMTFASWTYEGYRQGRRNRRRPSAHIPEELMGDVDCMSCLVKGARP